MGHELQPGDDVVHAVHGPGRVISVQMRDTADGPREYVTVEVEGMRVLIPTSELESVGLREPISADEAREILEMLGEDPLKDPGHAGRRRRNQQRLVSGDAEALAKIVRSLRALKADRDKPLPYSDKEHLRQAMTNLVGELSMALGVSEEEARQLVADAVSEDTS